MAQLSLKMNNRLTNRQLVNKLWREMAGERNGADKRDRNHVSLVYVSLFIFVIFYSPRCFML